MEKQYKYVVPYLSRDLIYQKIHPLQDAAFGAACLTPFRILKIIIVILKKWILVMLSRIATCCKNFQILIREMKFLHLLSKFHGYIWFRRKMNFKTAIRNTLCQSY